MSITATDVNTLRQMTGAGMMDCKKALTEANGDFEAAIDLLRKKGQKVSAARADKEANEGAVFVKTKGGDGIVVTLSSETDFVAKNADFMKLGNAIAEAALTNKPGTLDDLKALQIEGKSVSEHLIDIVGKIAERIDVTSYSMISGETVIPYVHSNSKVGVLVALKNVGSADVTEVGKDVAMQIAAMKPVAVDKGDVDPSTIEREIEIGKEQARSEGKAEAMLEKIALGKLNKFYKDSTLLNQEFVKDPSKTISQLLDSVNKGLTVTAFKRIQIGG